MKRESKWAPYFLGILTGIVLVGIFYFVENIQKEKAVPQRSFQQGQFRQGIGSGVPANAEDRVKRQAEMLGMSEEDLQKELDSGKSFAEIAQDKGVDISGFSRSRNMGMPPEEPSEKETTTDESPEAMSGEVPDESSETTVKEDGSALPESPENPQGENLESQ